METGELLARSPPIRSHASLDIAIDPTGRALVTAPQAGIIQLRSPVTGEVNGPPLRSGRQQLIRRLVFHPRTGELFALVANALMRWDLQSGSGLGPSRTLNSSVQSIALNMKGTVLTYSGGEGKLHRVNFEEGTNHPGVTAPLPGYAPSTQLSEDGSVCLYQMVDGEPYVVDIKTGKLLPRPELPFKDPASGLPFKLTLGPNGKQFAVGTADGEIQVHDLAKGRKAQFTLPTRRDKGQDL